MSTYLQLCQDTARECGIPGTGPTAVTGQTGELADIVRWVKQAWTEIQNRHETWRWMRHGFTVDTTAGDDTYAFGDCTDTTTSSVITRFGHWHLEDYHNPPKVYLTSGGVANERWLIYTTYEWFQTIYGIGAQNNGIPTHIAITPADAIKIGHKPDDIYTVTGEYYRSAQVLAADGDVPEMPTQFHDLIMYRAMEKYAMFESAPEILTRAVTGSKRYMRNLEKNQLPKMRLGVPLA